MAIVCNLSKTGTFMQKLRNRDEGEEEQKPKKQSPKYGVPRGLTGYESAAD
jgi:hypothetical protein